MSVRSVGNNNAAPLSFVQEITKATETPATSGPSAATGGARALQESNPYQSMFGQDSFESSGTGGMEAIGGLQDLATQVTQLVDAMTQLTNLLSGGEGGVGGVPELGGATGGAPAAAGPQASAGSTSSPGAGAAGKKGEVGPPPGSINAKDYGVVGDGKTDDQAALQKAFDAAKATGKPLYLGPGTYNHSGVLTLDGASLVGNGDKTVLKATNPDQGAIKLTGDGASISNMKTEFASAPSRSSMPDAAAVLVQNASGASVSNMTIQGAASNGVRLDNSTGATVSNNLVVGTNADGIALMNGSSSNTVKNNVVSQAGDDSYSDNSYNGDAKQDGGNTFENNVSMDNAYGRGIVLAGSKNDKVIGNTVSGSKWIGISGDSDPNSGTMASSGHDIKGNTVINNPNGPAVQYSMAGGGVDGTKTSGSLPDLASVLGWDPGAIPARTSFNPVYQPGTGSGANNSGGNRS
ncbi:right-handed parallel beta-helix repeat-containing protein [Stigmatella aurantiaca]|nr:right-handed parallel beta-helix repeat-containing protein [Stigmatella aurantiaca]ADO69150.1 uncharacterized protein STAUR_1346 [Stigmatella aurantiaca DW4/3-1]